MFIDNKNPAPRKSEPLKNRQQVKVKEQKINKKSNKEIIAVILILFVFTGICLGIKILFDDKFDKIVVNDDLAQAEADALELVQAFLYE